MRYEDAGLLAQKQFMLDIGLDAEEERELCVTLNKRPQRMPEGRRIYREEEDFFRLIVFGPDAFILSDEKLYGWADGFFGSRKPEFMLNFQNLRQLDERLKENGLMIDEVQECYLPSFILFEPDEDGFREAGLIEPVKGSVLPELVDKREFPHALVSMDRDITALGFRPAGASEYAAAAGAQRDGAYLWQIGVDVMSAYRGRGIATELVYTLAQKLIREEKLPFYGVRPGNIISKKVALAAGFEPAFSEVFVKAYA